MTRTETPWGPWEPAALADVAALLSSVEVPWWVAGGHAIELAVGYSFRDHSDVDVLLLRRDQRVVQGLLPTWEWWAADPPGTLRPWQPGETLSADVHDIWCRPGPSEPWRIQIMLDEAEGQDCISRRCAQVRRPIDLLGRTSGLHSQPSMPVSDSGWQLPSPRRMEIVPGARNSGECRAGTHRSVLFHGIAVGAA